MGSNSAYVRNQTAVNCQLQCRFVFRPAYFNIIVVWLFEKSGGHSCQTQSCLLLQFPIVAFLCLSLRGGP